MKTKAKRRSLLRLCLSALSIALPKLNARHWRKWLGFDSDELRYFFLNFRLIFYSEHTGCLNRLHFLTKLGHIESQDVIDFNSMHVSE